MHICSHMLIYAHICSHMFIHVHMCSYMFIYVHVCSYMFTCAHICLYMLIYVNHALSLIYMTNRDIVVLDIYTLMYHFINMFSTEAYAPCFHSYIKVNDVVHELSILYTCLLCASNSMCPH